MNKSSVHPPAVGSAPDVDELERLREALAKALWDWTAATWSDSERREMSKYLLSGPLAPLLAEVRRLRAVETASRRLDAAVDAYMLGTVSGREVAESQHAFRATSRPLSPESGVAGISRGSGGSEGVQGESGGRA